MLPLFSVLIANYNNAHYIEEAIHSVFSQSYENWEIVIVDDASTDNSMEILSNYKNDSRIRIFSNDNNYGCGYTKRKCVELASGTIVGFLDPDDMLTNDAIESMIEIHKINPDCALAYSNFIFCDEFMKIERFSNFAKQIIENSSYLNEKTGTISHFATFKVVYYNKTVGIDAKFKRAVDQSLYLVLEESGGRLIYVNKHLYLYRRNPNGISRQSSHLANTWSIAAKIDACRRRNLDIESIISNFIPDERKLIAFYENSLDSKIGSIILKPFRTVKKIFRLK
jgi:glycosyltransferase involved in cell wall biosynthesis